MQNIFKKKKVIHSEKSNDLSLMIMVGSSDSTETTKEMHTSVLIVTL